MRRSPPALFAVVSVVGCGSPRDAPVEHATCEPAPEVCDGVDNDCNGAVDDGAVDALAWLHDADGDGFGAGNVKYSCEGGSGLVAAHGDCDDGAEDVHLAALESCDGQDNDCDGTVDEGCPGLPEGSVTGHAVCSELFSVAEVHARLRERPSFTMGGVDVSWTSGQCASSPPDAAAMALRHARFGLQRMQCGDVPLFTLRSSSAWFDVGLLLEQEQRARQCASAANAYDGVAAEELFVEDGREPGGAILRIPRCDRIVDSSGFPYGAIDQPVSIGRLSSDGWSAADRGELLSVLAEEQASFYGPNARVRVLDRRSRDEGSHLQVCALFTQGSPEAFPERFDVETPLGNHPDLLQIDWQVHPESGAITVVPHRVYTTAD